MPLAFSHILVIDDDAPRRERVARPFAGWDWAATYLSGEPAAALAALAAGGIDVVLLNLDAAERDDYAFLRGHAHDPTLNAIPVVVTAWPGVPIERLAGCVRAGAADYIIHPEEEILLRARLTNVLQRKLLQEQAGMALEAFNEIEKIADDLRLVILPLGAALSAEAAFDRLIARIVAEAQAIANADTGALFLARDDGLLHHTYLRVQSLDFTYQAGSGAPELIPAMPLTDAAGEPNVGSLPVYVALKGESLNLSRDGIGRLKSGVLAQLERTLAYEPESILAVPLRNGQVVGALLLANRRQPGSEQVVPFDAYHQQVAESLASQAAVVLNNRLLSEAQAQLMRYKRELEIGREIQLSFLPARLPNPDGWELVARFQPALEVAGDFYDAFRLPHGYVVLIIADVVGKGVTAALFMAIIRSLFRALFQQNYYEAEPAPAAPGFGRTAPFPFIDRDALVNAVRLTNAYLIGNHGDTYTFATLFAAVIDPHDGHLWYVNAGHNPPQIFGPVENGERAARVELSPTGPAIGLLTNVPYQLGQATLAPGELLLAYTDGVTEARNPAAEELGLERVEHIVRHAATAEEALSAIEEALRVHTTGAEPFDDMTMVALRRLETGTPDDE